MTNLNLIIILIILILIVIYKKKCTKKEHFADVLPEAIANVASLYNTGNMTISNMKITGDLNALAAITHLKGGTSAFNPGNYESTLPWTDGKNYLRGDTKLDGSMNIAGNLDVNGYISSPWVETANGLGTYFGDKPKNRWIFHTPNDGRKSLHFAFAKDNNVTDWNSGFTVDPDSKTVSMGNLYTGGNITSNGVVNAKRFESNNFTEYDNFTLDVSMGNLLDINTRQTDKDLQKKLCTDACKNNSSCDYVLSRKSDSACFLRSLQNGTRSGDTITGISRSDGTFKRNYGLFLNTGANTNVSIKDDINKCEDSCKTNSCQFYVYNMLDKNCYEKKGLPDSNVTLLFKTS